MTYPIVLNALDNHTQNVFVYKNNVIYLALYYLYNNMFLLVHLNESNHILPHRYHIVIWHNQ